jgi:hypothetical protein
VRLFFTLPVEHANLAKSDQNLFLLDMIRVLFAALAMMALTDAVSVGDSMPSVTVHSGNNVVRGRSRLQMFMRGFPRGGDILRIPVTSRLVLQVS